VTVQSATSSNFGRGELGADTVLAATKILPLFAREGDQPKAGGGTASAEVESGRGMAEMSEGFRKQSGEIFRPAAD
jgi:hypothetical protein